MSDRLIRCRYLPLSGDRCTAEAVDPLGEVILCVKHLARALELMQSTSGLKPTTTRKGAA